MDKKKQEKEVMDYVKCELRPKLQGVILPTEMRAIRGTVKTIMRRYDLFDCEDMPRED